MAKEQKTINLALQGGGAHGALTWGIIDRLLEDGRIQFDSVSATSAGAMNAAVLAHGLAKGGNEGAREALYQFWKDICDAGEKYNPIKINPIEEAFGIKLEQSFAYFIFDFMNRIFSPYQLNPLNFNPLREILEDTLDIEAIKSQSPIQVFLSATNVKSGKIKIFENKDISIDAILASACLPFMFQAVKVEEEYFWDGGYMGNPAFFPLIYHSKSRDILIIHINPIQREEVPKSAAEIINRVNEISFNSSLLREMRAIAFVTKMLDDGWVKDKYKKQMKRVYIHAIHADFVMRSFSVASKLNSRWSFIKELHKIGRQQAEGWLAENFDKIGKESSIDLDEYL